MDFLNPPLAQQGEHPDFSNDISSLFLFLKASISFLDPSGSWRRRIFGRSAFSQNNLGGNIVWFTRQKIFLKSLNILYKVPLAIGLKINFNRFKSNFLLFDMFLWPILICARKFITKTNHIERKNPWKTSWIRKGEANFPPHPEKPIANSLTVQCAAYLLIVLVWCDRIRVACPGTSSRWPPATPVPGSTPIPSLYMTGNSEILIASLSLYCTCFLNNY